MQTFDRRKAIMLGAGAVTLGASALGLSACGKGAGGVTSDDMTLGDKNAKVTVIEYASLACSHCAKWNKEVYPAFKAKYIDTGKVHYVFREFITSPPQLAVAGTLMARCAGPDKYFSVVDAVFHGQEEIFRTGDIRGVLLPIAQSAGMDEDAFMKCVSDEKAINDFTAKVERYAKEADIKGTPTFFFNGEKYDKGEMSMADMEAAYAKALASAK